MSVEDRPAEATETSAAAIRNRAAQWLVKRRDHGDWSTSDQSQLDAWLVQAPSHKVAYLRVDAAWQRADRLGALRNGPRPRSVLGPLVKIAAGGVVSLVFGAFVFLKFDMSSTSSYVTGIGGHETIALGDGSQIELNTDTALRIKKGPTQRTVWLDKGEAYFQVAHSSTQPFVVIAGNHRITDLGTRFLVRRDEGSLKVALFQGQAQFDGEDTPGRQQAILNPGDVVVATAHSLSIIQQPMQNLDATLGWRRGLIIFHHSTLAAAASEYNRYNRKKIIIADQSVARLNINGSLPANDVNAFARTVQTFFNLRVEQYGDEVVISR